MLFVSKFTQLTSEGGSYKSKNLESTPIKNGNGACRTSANPRGHKGIYGHCHLNGNSIIAIASLTDVSTSGRNECTSIFCSVRINNNISKQLSGPKLMSN